MAEIILRGEVGVDITLWKIVSEVKNIPDNVPIVFRITSEGGSALEGREIYNYLKGLNRDITMIAEAFVASAATLIFLGAKTRIAANAATEFLIHNPILFGLFMGDDEDANMLHEALKEEKQAYAKIYSQELGISEEVAESLMKKNQIIDTDVAIKMGFISEIRSEIDTEVYQIAAKSYYKHKTDNQMDEKLKEQMQENTNVLKQIADSIKAFFTKDIKALKLATEEGAEIEIEGDELVEGANVTTGEDGTYTLMYDSRRWTVVIEGGVVTTVTEIVEDEAPPEDVEALKAENEALKLKIAELEGVKAEVVSMQKEIEQIKAIATPFKQPDGSYSFKAESQTAENPDEVRKQQIADFKEKRFGKKPE